MKKDKVRWNNKDLKMTSYKNKNNKNLSSNKENKKSKKD